MRPVLALLAAAGALAVPLAVCARPASGQPETFYSAPDDADLAAATDAALRTLPVFWAKYKAHDPAYRGFSVKVVLPTDDGRGEEGLWMTVDEVKPDGSVVGRLANDPAQLKRLHAGSVIEVDPSRIEDWLYGKDGKIYGAYSTRALMKRASPEQRAQTSAILAPNPLESEAH